jgi:hypothetical protein
MNCFVLRSMFVRVARWEGHLDGRHPNLYNGKPNEFIDDYSPGEVFDNSSRPPSGGSSLKSSVSPDRLVPNLSARGSRKPHSLSVLITSPVISFVRVLLNSCRFPQHSRSGSRRNGNPVCSPAHERFIVHDRLLRISCRSLAATDL